jgi:hypothetical protein
MAQQCLFEEKRETIGPPLLSSLLTQAFSRRLPAA